MSTLAVSARPGAAWKPTAVFVLAATLAFAAATRFAVPVTVIGLLCCGLLHECLELRYVIGRFSARLTAVFTACLFVILSAIMLGRMLGAFAPGPGRSVEIVGGLGTLIVAALLGMRSWRRWAAVAVIGVTMLISLAFPAYYLALITHLHNVIPVIFLWDWAARHIGDREARLSFGVVQLVWAFVLPGLILSGALDPVLKLSTDVVANLVGDGHTVLAGSAPPHATALIATRWLVMFAYLQTMHYVVWIGFLPFFGRDATRTFERRVPALAGRRFVIGAVVAGALLALVFLTRYNDGKLIYSAVATYHVYLEFPLLLLVLFGAAERPEEAIG